jgi:hypothetical protein
MALTSPETDLVARLRWPPISGADDNPVSIKLRILAADEIERLRVQARSEGRNETVTVDDLSGWIEHGLRYGVSSKDARTAARQLLDRFDIKAKGTALPSTERHLTPEEDRLMMKSVRDSAKFIEELPPPSTNRDIYQPEEITGAEMDAIEDAAIAGKPLTSTKRAACQCCSTVAELSCGPSRFGPETWACADCWEPSSTPSQESKS